MMINMGLVWRSKAFLLQTQTRRVPLDDGRDASQPIEHAKGHRFSPLCVLQTQTACLDRGTQPPGRVHSKQQKVYITPGKPLALDINTSDKGC